MLFRASPEQLKALGELLLDSSGKTPLHERFRALFMLKAVGNDEVVKIVSAGFEDPSDLMKHELAYVLGQLSNPSAIPVLESVLVDSSNRHCPMVRHEAAEALGALSSEGSLPLLRRYLEDEKESREVRETCEVAIGKIKFDHSEEGKRRKANPDFPTIDPAPSSSKDTIPSLRTTLLDTSKPLFERYRAMFGLRDYGAASKEAIVSLAEGFNDQSALFRHEIAYVFGQLCSPHSIPSLLSRLRDSSEVEMVRHEAAEALGGIASDGVEGDEDSSRDLPPGGVLEILREWAVKPDAPQIVRESCQIAIDMWEYENSTDQFNPLDSLVGEGTKEAREKAHTTGMERSAAAAVAAGVN